MLGKWPARIAAGILAAGMLGVLALKALADVSSYAAFLFEALPAPVQRLATSGTGILTMMLAGFLFLWWVIRHPTVSDKPDGVIYRENIAHRKKITELEGQLAELQGGQAYIEQHLADTRPRDIDFTIRAMFIHRVVTGQIPDAKQRHYTVCEIASASDSGRLSGQIYETLDHAGLMAELRRNGPAQRRHMYQELGTWVIGDAESEVVAELVSTLRSAGLIVTYLPWSAVLDPPPSNDFEIEIIVGDRGDALRDSVFDQSRSIGLG